MYAVNVSSIQDFYQCRFRWWSKWVMNRVPRGGAPALDAGKLLHVIFEEHFQNGRPLEEAALRARNEYMEVSDLLPEGPERNSCMKAIEVVDNLAGCWHLWEEKVPMDEMLECEQPFEIMLPEYAPDITWRGRPDYVGRRQNLVWHRQNRGLASGMNFGTYIELQKRAYHEHLYAEYVGPKYCTQKTGLKLGGTEYNLVRKLKYHTYKGKKNEAFKTAEELFFQHPMSINLSSGQHKSVMLSMVDHVREMQRVERRWLEEDHIPSPNEKMHGGYGGNALDPFFLVLTGQARLEDETMFKDRENTYETNENTSD